MDYNAEVEKIIILQLSSLGVEIDGFPALVDKELFYSSAVFLVKTILPEEYTQTIPDELAKGVGAWTHQMKQAKALAKLLKETLKFEGGLTFDNILYPNELHVRSVLSYLIQLVQRKRQREETLRAGPDERVGISEKVIKYLEHLASQSFTISYSRKPKPYLRPIETNTFFFPERIPSKTTNTVLARNKRKDQLSISVFEDSLKSLTHQWSREREWQTRGSASGMDREKYFQHKKKKVRGLVGMILRRQGAGYSLEDPFLRNSRRHGQKDDNGMSIEIREAFSRRVNFESSELDKLGEDRRKPKEEEEAEAAERRGREIDQLNIAIERLSEGMGKLREKMQVLKGSIAPLSRVEEKEKKVQEGLMEEFNVLRTTCQLYEKKDENLKKLKKISSQSAQELMKMNTEWEKAYLIPKIDEIRSLKHQILHYKEQYKEETEKIKELKQKMSDMIQEIKQKQKLIKQLSQYYNSLPKDKDRNFYVEKILNIVRNINNQNAQIQKILIENKEIKGNISTTTEKALVVFKQLEEEVFEKAKEDGDKNPKLKGQGFHSQMYLGVMDMHNEFEGMIKDVNSEGEHLNVIRDLDSEIDIIKQRKDEENLKRVHKDLMAIKKENMGIGERIKKIQGKVEKFEDKKKTPKLLEGIL